MPGRELVSSLLTAISYRFSIAVKVSRKEEKHVSVLVEEALKSAIEDYLTKGRREREN